MLTAEGLGSITGQETVRIKMQGFVGQHRGYSPYFVMTVNGV